MSPEGGVWSKMSPGMDLKCDPREGSRLKCNLREGS